MEITELIEKDVNGILEKNKYTAEHINFQNNSINGVSYKEGKKYFFKIMTKARCRQEFKGNEEIKKQYPVPKLIEFLENGNIGTLVYEYDNTIKENQGLLHDFILECEKKNKLTKSTINSIFHYYDNSLKKLKKVNTYPMQEFYDKRINTRLIKWYSEWEYKDYEIIINQKIVIKLKEIINSLEKYFKENKKYLAFLSQGDPNTVNIGIEPIFMDLTTAGCNYIGAEIAAFIWSELIADVYLCPKYHVKSYNNHDEILQRYKEYKPNLEYFINKDMHVIKIDGKIKTSKIRKEILYEYFNIFLKNNIEIKGELKYYIMMRILCIFNIREMEELDMIYSFLCIGIFNNLLERDMNVLNNIKILLEEFTEEVK